jgi:hypothetical protein
MEALLSPLSSRLKRSVVDLQFSQPAFAPEGSTALPFVIPPAPARRGTGAQRSEGICSSLNWHLLWMEAPLSPLSSRPERSVVEGSAVLLTGICSGWKLHPPLCHPDRSVAQWRDLQFSQPASALDGNSTLPFVIPTERKRSGELAVTHSNGKEFRESSAQP